MKEKLRGLSVPTRVIAAIYLGSTLIGLILVWTGVDRLGWLYVLGFLNCLLPVEIFLCSLWVGVRNISTKKKWLGVVIFGSAYSLSVICGETFILVDFTTILVCFLRGAFVSAAGVGVGLGIKRFAQAVRNRKSK